MDFNDVYWQTCWSRSRIQHKILPDPKIYVFLVTTDTVEVDAVNLCRFFFTYNVTKRYMPYVPHNANVDVMQARVNIDNALLLS